MLSVVALVVSSCTQSDVLESISENKTSENLDSDKVVLIPSVRNNQTTEQLRQRLLKKYVIDRIKPNDATYAQYGKIGCGYDFFHGDNSKIELESQENIKGRILEINDATASRIEINPLHALDINIRTYQNFSKDFSEKFYSIADSLSFGASATFGFSWLASASSKYSKYMREATKQTEEDMSKTVFAQASASIKSKAISYTLGSMKSFSPEKDLNSSFFIDYHLLSPEELVNQYGALVLINYNLGAKAVASAGYTSREQKSSSELKKQAAKMLSFSCSGLFKKISAELNSTSQTSVEEYQAIVKNYSDGYINLAYRGGDIYSSFPKEIGFSDIKTGFFSPIDLNDWAKSVENNQVLVSINRGGLIPIFKVIREKNIANRIKNYLIKGENSPINESNISYALHKFNGMVYFVMYNKYGDTIILDKTQIPSMGYEWWEYSGPRKSPIPFIEEANPKTVFGPIPTQNVIDLTPYLSASDNSKVSVKFCKIKGSLYEEDVTYLYIRNLETGQKIALSFIDAEGFNEYQFAAPDNFEYVKNLNYIDMYAL